MTAKAAYVSTHMTAAQAIAHVARAAGADEEAAGKQMLAAARDGRLTLEYGAGRWNIPASACASAFWGGDGELVAVREDGTPDICEHVEVWRHQLLALWPVGVRASDTVGRDSGNGVLSKRKRGPHAATLERVMREMRAHSTAGHDVGTMKQIEWQAQFKASADTCRRALNKIRQEDGQQ